MSRGEQLDIVIVGAGIAGSALALALADSGYSLGIVEPQPLERRPLPQGAGPGDFDVRVSALTPRSVDLLRGLDAWPVIEAYRHCPYTHMTVWDAEGTGRIDFDSADLGAPALGHIVENRAIVDSLLARLLENDAIHRFDADRLAACTRNDDGSLHVVLDSGRELSARLVVGADGALSRVRELMAFQTREWDYGHRAIVATVEVAESHRDTAWQRFLPSGPLAFLPLPVANGRHLCSIVWSLQDALVEPLLAMDDTGFCSELERAFEGTLGPVLGASPRFAFPLRQRHAVDYIQPGVALVADAAHTIHPLAGQGINLGLQDVAVLAEELAWAHANDLAPGSLEALRRYQRRRKGENLLMMGAMDGFKRLFEQQALPLRWLRNAGMRGVDRLAPVKQRLMRHAMGVD
jgi:2-octaprenylphenol hydroxylase